MDGWSIVALAVVLLTPLVLLSGCTVTQGRLDHLLRLEFDDRDAAIRRLEADYAHSPTDWEAYFLGELQVEAGDYAAMNHWFDASLARSARYRDRIDARRRLVWRERVSEADRLFQDGDIAGAHRAYSDAAQLEPQRSTVVRCLAETRILLHGPDLASIETLVAGGNLGALWRWLDAQPVRDAAPAASETPAAEAAVSEAPISDVIARLENELAARSAGNISGQAPAEAAFVLGELYRKRGDYPAMVRWYDNARQWGSTHDQIIDAARRSVADDTIEKALAAYARSDLPTALALLDVCEVVQPDRADVQAAQANLAVLGGIGENELHRHLEAGRIDFDWQILLMSDLYHQHRFAAAALVADRILERDPQNALALLVHARLAIERGDLAQAETALEAALAAGAESPEAAFDLGIIRLDDSRYSRARDHFAQALRWSDDPVPALRQMAIIEFCRGEFDSMKQIALQLVTELAETGASTGDGSDRADHTDRADHAEAWRLLEVAARLTGDELLIENTRRKLIPARQQDE